MNTGGSLLILFWCWWMRAFGSRKHEDWCGGMWRKINKASVEKRVWKSYSNFTKPNDFVFVDNETGAQIKRDVYYNNWNFLVSEVGLGNHRTDTTFYCFRHTYASWRLMAGVDVFLLYKMMGCSVKYIEQHYGQPELDKMAEYLTKDAKLEEMNRFV